MAKVSYEKKKKDLASKGMPNPMVKKNVTSADKKVEMGVRTKKIAGQTNYIVGGHYFNNKEGANHFAKTGKTLPVQHAR